VAASLQTELKRVREALKPIKTTVQVVEPKSSRSRRTIALPAVAVKALNRCRVRQLEARMAAGKRWQDSGFVFTTPTGTVLDPRNLTRALKAILTENNLPATGVPLTGSTTCRRSLQSRRETLAPKNSDQHMRRAVGKQPPVNFFGWMLQRLRAGARLNQINSNHPISRPENPRRTFENTGKVCGSTLGSDTLRAEASVGSQVLRSPDRTRPLSPRFNNLLVVTLDVESAIRVQTAVRVPLIHSRMEDEEFRLLGAPYPKRQPKIVSLADGDRV
jgi:hypothetical protein